MQATFACTIETTCFTSGKDAAKLVDLHAAPSADSPVICSFFAGVGFRELMHKDGWVAVTVDGMPGLPLLSEEILIDDYAYHPVGYLAETDICEVDEIENDYLLDWMPLGLTTAAADQPLILLAAAETTAPLQAVMMPGEEIRLLGAHNGFYLINAGGLIGFVPQGSIETDARSAKLPSEVFWARPDYYTDPPLTFALVNPPEDDDIVALYTSAEADREPLASYACGTTVQLLDKDTSSPYCHVRTVDHEGYMARALLQVDGQPGKLTLTGIRGIRAYMNGEEFTLRSFPDEKAPSVNVKDGLYLTVLGLAGDWFLVRGTLGDIENSSTYQGYIRPTAATDFAVGMEPPCGLGIVILPDGLERTPLYEAPSADAVILGRYFHTTQVELLEKLDLYAETDSDEKQDESDASGNAFLHVRVDGKEGYILKDHIQPLTRYNESGF
jgi:hypothetical protein